MQREKLMEERWSLKSGYKQEEEEEEEKEEDKEEEEEVVINILAVKIFVLSHFLFFLSLSLTQLKKNITFKTSLY